MRDIDTSLLRAFVAVVDTGNFSRAAQRLNRTQSTLSMQIKRLEATVGMPLFERSVRPPVVTEAGERLLAYAREMLAINDAALESLRFKRLAGQVRLATMEDYAATRLAPLLREFIEAHPDIKIEIHTESTAAPLNQLGTRYDLALAAVPVGYPDGDLLYRGQSVWGASPHFVLAHHERLPLALYPQGSLFRRWATDALDAVRKRWRVALVSASYGAVVATVREGWALAVFKDTTFPADLQPLGPAEGLPPLPDWEMRLFWAPGMRVGATQYFGQFLAERLHDDGAPRPWVPGVVADGIRLRDQSPSPYHDAP
ncbi:MAG: LysR family transcriptional regulator [Candidatus Competibacterales bacterium]